MFKFHVIGKMRPLAPWRIDVFGDSSKWFWICRTVMSCKGLLPVGFHFINPHSWNNLYHFLIKIDTWCILCVVKRSKFALKNCWWLKSVDEKDDFDFSASLIGFMVKMMLAWWWWRHLILSGVDLKSAEYNFITLREKMCRKCDTELNKVSLTSIIDSVPRKEIEWNCSMRLFWRNHYFYKCL